MNRRVSLRTAIIAITLAAAAAGSAAIYTYMEYRSARFDSELYERMCREMQTEDAE